jgi:hypothetical protein
MNKKQARKQRNIQVRFGKPNTPRENSSAKTHEAAFLALIL